MSNDHNGLVDDPWDGQPRESKEITQRISEENEQSDNSPNGGSISHERGGIEKGEAEEAIAAALCKVGISSSWSGLLPRPEDFVKYPQSVQDKMVAWNDAQILNESARNDKLVSAEIKQGYISLVFTFLINSLIVVGVLVAFVMTGNPNVFWAFTLPGASVVGNVVISVKNKAKENEEHKTESNKD